MKSEKSKIIFYTTPNQTIMTSNQSKYPSTFPNRLRRDAINRVSTIGYDYSQSGMYFITICCQDMQLRFGKIENYVMQLNYFGKIAHDEWTKLPERFPNVILDAFQIMPNHTHGIPTYCKLHY